MTFKIMFIIATCKLVCMLWESRGYIITKFDHTDECFEKFKQKQEKKCVRFKHKPLNGEKTFGSKYSFD